MDSVAGRAMQGLRHRLRRRFHGQARRLGTASRTGTPVGLSGAHALAVDQRFMLVFCRLLSCGLKAKAYGIPDAGH